MKTLLLNLLRLLPMPLLGAMVTAVICAVIKPIVLPPGHTFYADAGLEWVANMRAASFEWLFLCLIVIACIAQGDATSRKTEVLRQRSSALATFYITLAAWSLTFPGLIIWGGNWHVASWVFGFLVTATTLRVAFIMIVTSNTVAELEIKSSMR